MKKFSIRELALSKMLALVCVVVVLGFAGCCKKKEKCDTELALSSVEADQTTKMAENSGEPPIFSDEEFFNFEDENVRDYTFISNDEMQEEDASAVARNEADFWEDDDYEDLNLAWEDNNEAEYNFKVVKFDLNRNNIRKDQKNAIKENVALAKNAAEEGKNLVVSGHCCQLGSASFNLSLSEKRAQAIKKEMVKAGISEKNVTVLGCGSEDPIVVSDSPDRATRIKELSANRRAEISIH